MSLCQRVQKWNRVDVQDATRRIRDAIRQRYVLLPYIYTLFRHANTSGVPVMRPLWFDFPEEPAAFAIDDEFMLGPGLLVRCLHCFSRCQTFHSMHCSVDMRARGAQLGLLSTSRFILACDAYRSAAACSAQPCREERM